MSKNPSSSPSSRMTPVNRSLSSPAPSTSTLQKLLGPLPRVGKVHCASGELHGGKCEDSTCSTRNRNQQKTLTSTSTSATPWFARIFLRASQDHMVTHMKPCDKEPSFRTRNSSRLISSSGTRRGSIPSLRGVLSHRSSSSSSYFASQQRRDSLELIYKQSENGVKYRPAIPHPLMDMAGGLDEGMAYTDEGYSLKMPSSLAAERLSRRGAQA